MARFRSIDSVARDICLVHLNDSNMKMLSRAIITIRNVLDEFQYHIPFFIRSEYFVISANYTVILPDNTIDVMKVGTVGNNGIFRIMGRNDRIRRKGDDVIACTCNNCAENYASATALLPTQSATCDACQFQNFWYNGRFMGEAYGYRIPEFPNGLFRYNKDDHRIEFSTGSDVKPGNSVLVEYRAAMQGEDYNIIPSEMVNCIGFRVAQILNIQNRAGVSDMNLREFRRSWDMLKRSYQTWSAEDFAAALMGQSRSSPKY